jgi:ubiquinone/menaquinone biosynthesis C-methylase UbiE
MKTIDFDFVADLYDSYVTVDFDLDFYRKLAKESTGKCLELMCGTGRVSIPLLKLNIELTCVDYSQEMLNVLQRKAKALSLNPRIECQDICELHLKDEYDLIIIPFNSFSEITDIKKQEAALTKIYRHLKPGGIFICTLYNPTYRIKTVDGQIRSLGKFKINESQNLVISYFNQPGERPGLVTGMQFYEIYNLNNKLIDKRYLDICFSLITKDELVEIARNAGFRLKNIHGDYNFSPYTETSIFMNFIFEK